MSDLTDVADAVVAELNTHSFSLSFTAERAYLPRYKKAKISSLKVWVVPAVRTSELRSHTTRSKQVQIDVGIGAPVSPESNTSVDPYDDLLEAIDDFLAFRSLDTYVTAKWTGSQMIDGADAGYSPDMLDSENVYLGVVRVTYKLC